MSDPIPPGHQVDHLCFVPPCVEPSHLEAVTPAENRSRVRQKPTCAQGHARQEGRAFHAIHFGSAHELARFDFARPEDFTPERILDYVEWFVGGGTNGGKDDEPLASICDGHVATVADLTGAGDVRDVFAGLG